MVIQEKYVVIQEVDVVIQENDELNQESRACIKKNIWYIVEVSAFNKKNTVYQES
ncbi:hypothetical protein [Bacillus sp. HMF5848]|uniref:hypothetical protein n=1 Tax=Bacillus sp. HMF5848 TaxID=2495421 RepID=UPI00163AF9C5|nr:hypothetical protein [Bacillus sp. HMF5848]